MTRLHRSPAAGASPRPVGKDAHEAPIGQPHGTWRRRATAATAVASVLLAGGALEIAAAGSAFASTASTTSVNSGTAHVGDSVTLKALVDPTDGGGTVNFTSDGTGISGCSGLPFSSGGGTTWQASCTTSALPAGVHTIAASYSGDAAYNESVGTGYETIQGSTTTSVTTRPASPVTAGTSVALTAAVAPTSGSMDNGGTVTFTSDNTSIAGCASLPLVDEGAGKHDATCTTSAIPTGTHTVGATYSGDTTWTGSSGSTSLTVDSQPTITTSSLPGGTAGQAYSATLAATGGSGSYSWSVSSGSLPSGLTLSSAGVLSGTPVLGETSTFTVKVTDAATSGSGTKTFTMTVASRPGHGTYFVAPGGSGSSCAGNSVSAPFATIQAALACAGDGDVVSLAPSGTTPYPGIGTISHNVTLQAAPGSDARSVRVNVDGGTTLSDELTVATGASVAVTGVTIDCVNHSCNAPLVTNHGTLTLRQDTLTGQGFEAAVSNASTTAGAARLSVLASTIAHNTSIYGDSTGGPGAGIVTAAGNGAPVSSVLVANSTITDNTSSAGGFAAGAGVYAHGGTATLVNSTITDNHVIGVNGSGHGGGIDSSLPVNATVPAPITLSNTIVAGNTAGTGPDCNGKVADAPGGHNTIGNFTGCGGLTDNANGDQLGTNPALATLADNGGPTDTIALQPASPAIGTADPTTCTTTPINNTDQRGATRTTSCDRGAYDTHGTGGVAHGTYFVAPGGSGSSCAGNSVSAPFATIQAALACAGDGDVVSLAPSGTTPYPGIGTISHNVTLQAAPGSDARSVRVNVDGGTTLSDELTVATGASVAVTGVTIDCVNHSCNAPLVTNHGTLTLRQDTLTGQGFEAAVSNASTTAGAARLSVLASTIAHNTSIYGDSTGGPGAGIVTAAGNGAPVSSVLVANSTITDNTSSAGGFAAGAGVYAHGGTATLVNSTITDNHVIGVNGSGHGGGIDSSLPVNATVPAPITLSNTIVAGNTAGTGPDCNGKVADAPSGHNTIGNFTGCGGLTDNANGDQLGTNPALATLADNGGPTDTIALQPASPAIGTADPTTCTTTPINNTDQRGATRTTSCDRGAYDTHGQAPARVPGAPTIGTATAADGSASVTFTPPGNTGGAPITSYTVTSSPDATHPHGVAATGASSPITVPGLTNGTAYTFRVGATNSAGTGPLSAASNSVTPMHVVSPPDAPSIDAVAAGSGSATVTFTAGDSNGAPITGFTVTAADQTSAARGGQTASGTSSPITVSGLTNGDSYRFTITATNSAGTGPSSDPSAPVTPAAATSTVQDNAVVITYDSWSGVADPAASGGSYRVSSTANAKATFGFTGTSVHWLVRKGPDRGNAAVTIDGVNKGTVDLYAAGASNATLTYAGLANRAHNLVIRVAGTKRAAATGTKVVVDGFQVGNSSTTIQDTAGGIAYGSWTGTANTSASGGTYRSSPTANAAATTTFTGTGIDWITAVGPAYGKASVSIDGGPAVVVDLYRRTVGWRSTGRSVRGLPSGSHTITVKALGTKNSAATGTRVVLDGFVVHS